MVGLMFLVLLIASSQPLSTARPLKDQLWLVERALELESLPKGGSSSGHSNCSSDPNITGGNCPPH